MKKVFILSLALLILLGLPGCGGGEEEKISIRGTIANLTLNQSGEVTGILVEGKIEKDTAFDKASISFDKDTRFVKGSGNEKITKEDLEKGMSVEAAFTGPVAESYPVQARAQLIRVLE